MSVIEITHIETVSLHLERKSKSQQNKQLILERHVQNPNAQSLFHPQLNFLKTTFLDLFCLMSKTLKYFISLSRT